MAIGLSALTIIWTGYQLKPKHYDKMNEQIKKVKSLDALLVPGGEGGDHSRSNHVKALYNTIEKTRESPLNIVLAGYWSGLSSETPKKAESEVMKDYLIFKDIPKEAIFIEDKSKDTLANMIYSQPILKDIDAKKIGLVTDKYHMKRALWTAKRVLGKGYEVYPCPNNKDIDLVGRAQEILIRYAQAIDLCVAGVKSGDQKAFEKYLREKHPFHAQDYGNEAPFGAYKLGISLKKK